MDAQEAVALALEFAEGMRASGATADAQAGAVLKHLVRNGFLVVPRVGCERGKGRQPFTGVPKLTGRDVRAARAALGLDRSMLASLAGIKRRTLDDFESGRREPHQRTLDAISAALEEAARPASTLDQPDNP